MRVKIDRGSVCVCVEIERENVLGERDGKCVQREGRSVF